MLQRLALVYLLVLSFGCEPAQVGSPDPSPPDDAGPTKPAMPTTPPTPTTPATPGTSAGVCGDGQVEMPEACDDGNQISGDGCSMSCAVEHGWTCALQQGSMVCQATCGDGVAAGQEACDDGNTVDGDGCSATCRQEASPDTDGQPTDQPQPTFGYGEWVDSGACSSTCGEGQQARQRACLDEGGSSVDCALCGGLCQQSSACVDTTGCTYSYGEWSDWSSCAQGVQTRARPCLRADGQAAACELCGGECNQAAADACAAPVPPSPEEALVRQAYCRVLMRPAAAAGLSYWAGQVVNGLSIRELVQNLAISAEFRQSFVTGQPNATVVARLYDGLLARAPEATGAAYYLGKLNAGTDYVELVAELVTSTEYTTNFGDDTVPGNGRPGCN